MYNPLCEKYYPDESASLLKTFDEALDSISQKATEQVEKFEFPASSEISEEENLVKNDVVETEVPEIEVVPETKVPMGEETAEIPAN